MKIRLLLLCLLGSFLSAGILPAQFGLQTGLLRDRAWSQSFNPANLAYTDFETFQFNSRGDVWLGNNRATIEGIFVEGNTITRATADRLVADLGNSNVLAGGFQIDLLNVNVKIKERKWGFYLGQGLTANLGFDNPLTLGLALNGNGPYVGDTIVEEEVFANLQQFRSLGAGTSFDLGDKVKLGVRLNLLQGTRLFRLEETDYRFFTATNGTLIDLDANYTFYNTPDFANTSLFDFNGFGASVNAGVVVELNESMALEAAITDLGFMSWTTDRNNREVRLESFEGIVINSILTDSLDGLIENQVDSLENLVLPDSTRGNLSQLTPVRIRLGYSYKVGEKGLLNATLVYSPIKVATFTPIPLIGVTYQHEVVEGLRLGANAYAGGIDSYGFGLMGTYRIDANKAKIDLLLGGDNLIGLFAPSAGRGMSFYGGVGLTID